MKKILMAAVALTAMTSAPAFAADFAVTGSVTASCGAVTGSTIAFGTIGINATDGTLASGQSQATDPQPVYCNGANSTITVSYTALSNTTVAGSAPSGFTKTIDFTPAVDFGDTSFAVGTSQSLGAKAGNLVVHANTLTAGGNRPMAGDYSGSITVTLTPGV